jgi:predicted deacylase
MNKLLTTLEEILDRVSASGKPVRVLGYTPSGLPIVCARTGGERQPPILITAGAHADEVSGVFAAVELIESFETEHETYIVPLRDPTGFAGYPRALARALVVQPFSFAGSQTEVSETSQVCEEIETCLRSRGRIVCAGDDWRVCEVSGELFAFRPPSSPNPGSFPLMQSLHEMCCADANVAHALKNRRVLLPALLPDIEECGAFARGYTVVVTEDGVVENLNRLFDHPLPPLEVRMIRDLIDQVRPGLALDLHEGFGTKFYLIVGQLAPDSLEERIALGLRAGVRAAGYAGMRLDEMAAQMPPRYLAQMRDLGGGIITFATAATETTFSGYCHKYGPAFTVEVGYENDLGSRVAIHLAAVRGAVRAFETYR